ncbi:MAG: hypothetical protein QGG36_33020 [Pirellulaceae bacterium]|jgi:hypothetical protein|nr:hypothetical protein [Pirellulaceae bacterium]MDP7020655.1 hypothetical protein [Pirellulaceae bacterium]
MDYTAALAQLLTNPELRAAHHADPQSVCRDLALDADDAQTIVGLDPGDVERQARLLIHKRFFEIQSFLPRTLSELDSARGHFERFAATYWPTSHRRHLLDAAAFAQYLIDRRQPVVRSEVNWVQFRAGGRRIALRFAPDVETGDGLSAGVQLFWRRGGAEQFWELYWNPRRATRKST